MHYGNLTTTPTAHAHSSKAAWTPLKITATLQRMFLVRRVFRWSFTLGGLFFLHLGLRLYAMQHGPDVQRQTFLAAFLPILCLAISFVFILAWWSTRKTNSDAPKPWALIASGINVVYGTIRLGLHLLHSQPVNLYSQIPAVIALGVAGILLFRPRIAPSKRKEQIPATQKAKSRRVAGDRTSTLGDEIILSVSLIAQFIAVRLWYSYAHARNIPLYHEAYYYALAVAAGLFATAIHECGHTLAGMFFRMELVSFETGPFRWFKGRRQWQFEFTPLKFTSLGGAAGVRPASPTTPQWHEVVVIAAGPATSLVLGLLSLHVALNSQPMFWQFFAFPASAGLIAAVINLLPLRLCNGGYSDGARLLQLATSSPLVEYKKVSQLIHSTKMTKLRPRDVDPEMVRCAIETTSFPQLALEMRLFLTAIHADQGSRSRARASFLSSEIFIRQNELEVPANLLSSMVIDAARFRRDPTTTHLWWERLQKASTTPHTFDDRLATIAELWMQGLLEDAREMCLKAQVEARTLKECGAADVQRKTCDGLLKEIELAIAITEYTDTPVTENEPANSGEFVVSAPRSQEGTTSLEASEVVTEQATATLQLSERRRWPRATTPGRNMWPRPNVG